MSGKDVFKFGVVVIVGAALFAVFCAAVDGAFDLKTAMLVTAGMGGAVVVGLIVGAAHGEDVADRRACGRALQCLEHLKIHPLHEITRESKSYNDAITTGQHALRRLFREDE